MEALRRRDGNGAREEARSRGAPIRTHPFEWIVATVSATVVTVLIVFIFFQAVTEGSATPNLTAEVERIARLEGGHLVSFRAANHADVTAAGVIIEGRLVSGDRTVETAEVTIDYVPAHSRRRGGLIFQENPRDHRLELKPKSFKLP